MKYYFITYQATSRCGINSIWNECIDTSPMEFIKDIIKIEKKRGNNYYNFVVINTCEISEADFNKYYEHF